MKSNLKLILFLLFVNLACTSSEGENQIQELRNSLADELDDNLTNSVLASWYPKAMDTVNGGYYSSFTYDFKLAENQDKMIVTQARHTWTNAKAALRYPEVDYYKKGAKHGFEFLRDKLWDQEKGGFYWLVDQKGNVKDDSTKTAYGNAFGIYGLAAYYEQSNDPDGLDLAKKAFYWLDSNAHDPVFKGYFQHLDRSGKPQLRQPNTSSTSNFGYKDQNSSIHILEAFTELYQVWPDPLLKSRLVEMLYLTRDQIVTEKGSLTLFLYQDWTPVSFSDSSEAVIQKHHLLDHVSFGHDVETAYLMLEASHVLGIEKDSLTHQIAKKMVDHALDQGWDSEVGGFYDEGYYFKDGYRVTHKTKNWWAQAEGLNALLLMADLYPEDKHDYFEKFQNLWEYTDSYLIDHEFGDWYSGGLDEQPDLRYVNKGNIWKSVYHHYRSLDQSIQMLRKNTSETNPH